MHRWGGMVLGAIECHQELARKPPKVVPQAVVLKVLKDLKIHAIEVMWHERIEQVTDLIVTGHLLHAKQGAGIIAPLGLLQVTLVV
jgi:hypothetical protein